MASNTLSSSGTTSEKSSSQNNLEVLQFLFEKRMQLFNVRREHEWKIQLSVIGALGIVDYAILSNTIILPDVAKWIWRGIIPIIFIVCIIYQLGVQKRNRVDRIIMDEINKKICDHLGEPEMCTMRTLVDVANEKEKDIANRHWTHHTFLWAFFCQTIILFLICGASLFVPNLVSKNSEDIFSAGKGQKQYTLPDSLTLKALVIQK